CSSDLESLENPSWDRLFHIWDALSLGVPITSIQKATRIDRWFLMQINELVLLEGLIKRFDIRNLPKDLLVQAKENGFSDMQIAWMLKCTEDEVYEYRKSLGVNRVYKMVDTCAAEFPAQTPYFYSTFESDSQNGSGTGNS